MDTPRFYFRWWNLCSSRSKYENGPIDYGNGATLTLGRVHTLEGLIDDIRIYDSVLSPLEMDLYSAEWNSDCSSPHCEFWS